MSNSETKKVTLKSSDGEAFEIEEAVAMQMETMKNIIEDNCTSEFIPLPNVHSNVLSKVIEYCNEHAKNDEHEAFKAEFMQADMNSLFEILEAANYLNIRTLLDLTCQCVADRIKDETVEEVRRIFNIENDYPPEEEAEQRQQYQWAFQ